MAGGDFEAEIRNSIGALTSKVDGLSRSIQGAQKETRNLGREAAEHFQRGAAHARHAAHETEHFGHQAHEAGRALKGLGGALAEFSHMATSGGRFEGGLSRIAAAASLAGFGLEAFNRVIENNIERTKEQIENTDKLEDSLRKVNLGTAGKSLSWAEQNDRDLRLLQSRGPDGEGDAQSLIKAGFSAQDARRATANSYLIADNQTRYRALDAAQMVAGTGEMSLADVVNKIAGDPVLRARILQDGGARDVAQRLIVGAHGTLATSDNLDLAGREIDRAAKGNKTTQELDSITAQRNKVDSFYAEKLNSGVALGEVQRQTAEELNPFAAVLTETNRINERHIAALEKLAETQGRVGEIMANVGMLLGGKGSYRNQVDHARTVTAVPNEITSEAGGTLGTD